MFKWMMLGVCILIASEIAIFVLISHFIGFGYTFLLLVAVAIFGIMLVKQNIKMMLRYANEQLAVGILPTASVLDAMCILLAGVLFILPGLLSDVMALSLIFPWTRKGYKLSLYHFIKRRMSSHASYDSHTTYH
jgi:UPF0716 protein FxsA